MASPWDQFEAVTPEGQPGPNPPPGYDLVPLTGADPAKPVELEGKNLDNEGQRLTNEGKRIDLEIKKTEAGEKTDPALQTAIKGLGLDELLLSVGRARKNLESWWSTGIPGALAEKVPGTARNNLLGNMEALKGAVILEKLQALKEASKTGASGMGALSEKEGDRLAAAVAALSPNMSDDELETSLAVIARHAKVLKAIGDGKSPDDPKVQKEYGILPLPGQETLGPGDIGFNTPDQPTNPLTPEQQQAYDAFWKINPNATAEQLRQFGASINVDIDNAEKIIEARDTGAGVKPGDTAVSGLTPEQKAEVDRLMGATDDAGAVAAGAADTVTLGHLDEAGAAVDALTGSLSGEGSFRDLYGRNVAVNREFASQLQERSPWAYASGQVAGGFVLPVFAARTPAQLAKIGAAYGGAYGTGSAESLSEVPLSAATGAGFGAAAGWGGGKLLEKLAGRSARPAGETAADRYARGQKFGMDLSIGDTRGLGSKIMERGLDISPGSAGTMNAARKGLGEQTIEAVDNVAATFGPTTSHAGMGEAAQRGANKWIDKFERVSGKLYDAIPISPKAQSSLTNTRQALGELTTIFESNPKMAEAFTNTKLSRYMEALTPEVQTVERTGPRAGLERALGVPEPTKEVGGKLNWSDLKTFRTRIGEEIGDQRFSDSPTKTELRRLYAALSEDMRDTAAAQGPKAIKAFERANTQYRLGQQRIDDALVKILGDDASKSPEAAASKLQAIVKEGKSSSDLKLVHEIWKSLPAAERGEVSNGLIRLLGAPAGAEGRGFSPETFIRNFDSMAPGAKNLLFGAENKALRENLEEFGKVARDMAANNSTRNTSNTAQAITGAVMYGIGSWPGLLGQAATTYGAAKLWTNPKFVRWATGYSKMMKGAAKAGKTPSEAGGKTHAKLLEKLAASEPALAQDIIPLRDAIIRAANDNAAAPLAASGSDEQQ